MPIFLVLKKNILLCTYWEMIDDYWQLLVDIYLYACVDVREWVACILWKKTNIIILFNRFVEPITKIINNNPI